MNKYILSLLILRMLIAFPLIADEETSPYLEHIIPASPNAAALARFGEYPVSLASGVPQISIPIYDIQVGNYTLPISLDYHASGIKVDEIATSVGLGWSLNAGGTISRTIMDVPDDLLTPGMYGWPTEAYIDSLAQNYPLELIGYLFNHNSQQSDTEADRFSYSFAGKSGIFRYSSNRKQYITLPYEPICILPFVHSFYILDTDGTEYYFDKEEYTGVADDGNAVDNVSAWHLSRICLPTDTITLTYEKELAFISCSYSECVKAGIYRKPAPGGGEEDKFDAVRQPVNTKYVHTQQLVKQIRWKGGIINFTYSTDRKDLPNARLSQIEVKSATGVTSKTVSLAGSYIGSTRNIYTCRLLLSSVTDSSTGKYELLYNTTYEIPPLISYDNYVQKSKCQSDYWGYFNGKTSKLHVPYNVMDSCLRIYYHGVTPTVFYHWTFDSLRNISADRTPELEYAQTGTLRQMKYPTGGYTRFSYELNKADNGTAGGLRIKEIANYNKMSRLQTLRRFGYQGEVYQSNPEDYMHYDSYYIESVSVTSENQHIAHERLRYNLLSSPVFPMSSYNGSGVHYNIVTETFLNGDSIVHYYQKGISHEAHDSYTDRHPNMARQSSYDEGSGSSLPLRTEYYLSDTTLLKTETYNYSSIVDVDTLQLGCRVFSSTDNNYMEQNIFPEEYARISYCGVMGCSTFFRLLSKTETDHQTGVTHTEYYTYDDSLRTKSPRTVSFNNSDGRNWTTSYTYSFDYPESEMYSHLYDCNDVTTPVTTVRKNGSQVVSKEKIEYIWDSSRCWNYPYRILNAVGNEPYVERCRYSSYQGGHPQEILLNGTDLYTLSWDNYGNPSRISQGQNGTDQLTALYSVDPVLGLTEQTNPFGYSQSYQYSDGRLSGISDASGQLQLFSYNYCKSPNAIDPSSNYVKTSLCLDASGTSAISSYSYGDGLGRPSLSAEGGRNSSGNYLYSLVTYDAKGREQHQWMPVVGGQTPNGTQLADESSFSAASVSQYGESGGYVSQTYDALDRTVGTENAGEAWKSNHKSSTLTFGSNVAGEVKLYRAPLGTGYSLSEDGYYEAGSLNTETSTDEDGHSVTVYKDKAGQKIMERREGVVPTENLDTYYVYNDLGQLRFVLSPMYQRAGYKAKYAYEYRYDERGRLVKKILPGCDFEQYWYDDADRMIFMQDARLRSQNPQKYRFFLYDKFGRQVIQGLCIYCVRNSIVNTATYNTSGTGWNNTGYTLSHPGYISSPTIETVNYYDSYDYLRLYVSKFPTAALERLSSIAGKTATSMPTGIFQIASNQEPLLSAISYDDKGRQSDVRMITLGSAVSEGHNEYNYCGDIISTTFKEYTCTGNSLTEKVSGNQTHSYYPGTRLLQYTDLTLATNGGSQNTRRIKSLAYDGLGRMSSLTRNGNAGTTSYSYDLHGWLTGLTGKGFREALHYADGTGTPCYNGNISSQLWKTDNYYRWQGYTFTYDRHDRLAGAEYGENESLGTDVHHYDEKVLEYTANGAIKRLQRWGIKDDGVYGKIDNLSLSYDGNLLKKVTDDAVGIHYTGAFDFVDGADLETEYTYNGNGAMTSDANKGIASIEYDNLNHPKRIQFTNGNVTRYVYSPDGMKLRVVHETAIANVVVPLGTSVALNSAQIDDADSTDYRGNCLYEDGVLSKYLFDGGYVSVSGTSTTAHYYVKDHLGNNRAVVNENGTLEQVTNYYPFGGVFSDFQNRLNPDLQPYKYNGKELDRTHNLDWYDYGARMYDPTIGMFTSVDPSAGEYCNVSPFAYCIGNPVRYVDPDGKDTYRVDSVGVVSVEKNDKPNTLIGVGIDGKEKSLALDANQSEMLEGLLTTQEYGSTEGSKNTATSSTISKKSALALFKALADYSKVEWNLNYGNDNVFTIGTLHNDQLSPTRPDIEILWSIHSHSRIDGTKGASINYDYKTKIWGLCDYYNVYQSHKEWINSGRNEVQFPSHFIYHRYSQTTYFYGPGVSSKKIIGFF